MSGPSKLKVQNTKKILSILLKNKVATRQMLIEHTGLAASTVSMISGELLKAGLIREAGFMSGGGAGRRTQVLKRNPKAGYVITVFVTPEEVAVGLFDFSYSTVDIIRYEYEESFREDESTQLVQGVEALLERNKIGKKLKAICLALPTYPFDVAAIKRVFEAQFSAPVLLVNNVEAIALSEYYHQLHTEYNTIAYVYIGTGIGSALVLDGELYKGASGHASDLGHTGVVPNGSKCRCGRIGCLETKAAEWAISNMLEQELGEKVGSKFNTVRILKKEFDAGSDTAVRIVEEAAMYFGKALYNLAAVIDPEAIFISGRMEALNPIFSSKVEQAYLDLAKFNPNKIVPLKFIPLHRESGNEGAAIYSFLQVYC
ncbi:MAG: ROK family protein [bacterium]